MAQQLDTQGPLARRKALVARLMAQMQGLPQTPGTSVPGMGSGVRSAPAFMGGATQAFRAHLQNAPRLGGSVAPADRGGPQATPAGLPGTAGSPVFQGGGTPAPVSQAPPPAPPPSAPPPGEWTQQGFVSEEAMAAFNSMDEGSQARILANPVARRRYFL